MYQRLPGFEFRKNNGRDYSWHTDRVYSCQETKLYFDDNMSDKITTAAPSRTNTVKMGETETGGNHFFVLAE